MKKGSKRASWGDAELDRLWEQMRQIEMGMDDIDLAEGSPKLTEWEAVNTIFKNRMEALGR